MEKLKVNIQKTELNLLLSKGDFYILGKIFLHSKQLYFFYGDFKSHSDINIDERAEVGRFQFIGGKETGYDINISSIDENVVIIILDWLYKELWASHRHIFDKANLTLNFSGSSPLILKGSLKDFLIPQLIIYLSDKSLIETDEFFEPIYQPILGDEFQHWSIIYDHLNHRLASAGDHGSAALKLGYNPSSLYKLLKAKRDKNTIFIDSDKMDRMRIYNYDLLLSNFALALIQGGTDPYFQIIIDPNTQRSMSKSIYEWAFETKEG